MTTAQPQQMRWTTWAAFFALCLLSASSWLLPEGGADESSIAQQGFFYGIIGLLACAFSYRSIWARVSRGDLLWLKAAAMSILLLGVPVVAVEWTRDGISDINCAALFALVPFVIVVVAIGRELEPGVRRFFVPALISFGGVLLLLPFNFPTSPRGQIVFAVLLVVVALVGFGSERIYSLLRELGTLESLAIVFLANAVFLMACGLTGLSTVSSRSVASYLLSIRSLYSLVELLLLVWLLRAMSPVRLATRYLLVPLLSVLEGIAFLRPPLTLRMGAGLVLLVAGATYLLLSRGGDSDAVLSIR
ncbi:hypothetical protein [Edaphobacter dinghuensis]|uniref:Uncharacterized protein n=1 Tax=Edaphobacter dinghuensis TaxID=1560005 RepID=A0A917HJ79_9BACT|nr:hypothetical protein [Edaphobacter dinghuensis]GGG81412.1 hypothetical protein GCM10011585_26110 [Edaphobacter dinghuensis]